MSEAYGKSDYTILSYSDFQKDMKLMGLNDKMVFESWLRVDDDLQLADLIATIKNLPIDKNDTSHNITVSPAFQP